MADRMTAAVLSVLRAGWPVLLGVAIFVLFGRYGFNPTDEGFITEAAARVSRGQIPHLDFIWPRPGGSPYLHAPELLLPFPLVMTGRAIALAGVIGYSLLLGVLLIGRAPWRWSMAEVVMVSASVLINLNTMLLTVWPTFDGLMLVAAGAVVLRAALHRASLPMVAGAFLLFGAAALMKQSFWPAPILGAVWLVAASPRVTLPRRGAVAVVAAAVFPVLYLVMIGLAGGLDEMFVQFSSARPAVGIELISEVAAPLVVAALGILLAALAFLRLSASTSILARLAIPTIVALVAGLVIVLFGLRLSGGWGAMLWWLAAATVAARSLRDRQVDWPGMVILGCAWMASLSWGLAVPNLVAGSLAAYLVYRAVEDGRLGETNLGRVGALAVATLFAVLILPTFVSERLDRSYRDRPLDELTAELGSVHEDFAGVVTNPMTAAYLEEMVACVEAYPASEVAILPDNPIMYPILGLANPFPVVWIIPLEIVGSEERLVDAARELDARGDYLALFQSVEARRLAVVDSLDRTDRNAFRDQALGNRIRESFNGTEITCGSFDGFWSP